MARTGEAGRRGAAVRSDCWIQVELRGPASGAEAGKAAGAGLEVVLQSKVAGMYGASIHAQIEEGCRALGVTDARVAVEDQGALPFTIAARLEAAVRRAWPPAATPEPHRVDQSEEEERGGGGTDRAPDGRPTYLLTARTRRAPGGGRDRLRRSRLYLPGNEPKFFINAGLHAPDGLILDLEDSVAPAEKDAARVLVRNALRAVDFHGAERMVRINQDDAGLDDLAWIVPHGVHCILIPKVEHPRQVGRVQDRVQEIQRAHGLQEPIWLMPIIESAQGAWRAMEIAGAADTVVALAVGLEDYTADIGVQRTLDGRESFWARAQVINGARAAGKQAIDTVFSDVGDMEGLRRSVEEARALGFVGKGCIHPRQIPVVHEAFAPAPAEIERARRIVLAFEDAERRGLGVVALGSKMIDPPVVKRAVRTVETAVTLGKLAPDWRDELPATGNRGGAA
ncbi:MAG: aldolase/citrate lyase family protein [Candidatus Krumholzibacteriia bacterium]